MNVFELAAKLTLDSSEYENGLKGAQKDSDKLEDALKDVGKASKRAESALEDVGDAAEDYSDEIKETADNTNKYSESVETASKKTNSFADSLDKGINKLLKIGAVAAGAAVAGVTAFSRAAVNTGMQFDTAMSQVAATMGVTTDEIQELRDYAQQMGATTAFSATQAAQALNYMALAGYDAETSMSMLPNVLNLAAAGSMDLARASDMLTDSQSALGLTLDETNELVDKMAQTASKSNTSVEQLGDAILTVGGTAKNLTGGTTELATALGILADNGVKGAEGGTQLRNIILSLSAPTDTAAKKLNELGVSVYDAEGNMRGLNEIFGDLDESMSGLTQEQRMEALSTIFNNRDLKSAEALLANYGLRWDELSGYIDDAAGAAEKMAETKLDNLNGDITLMNSALEGAKIAFSDGITPALRNLVQMVTKALSNPKTTKFLKEAGAKIGEVATKLAQLAGGLLTRAINLFKNGGTQVKALAISFGALAVAIKAYHAASLLAANGTSLLTKAISFISSPMGAVITGLGVLTALFGVSAIAASRTAKSYSTLTDAEKENLDAALELSESYREGRDQRIRSMTEIDSETERTRALWEELQTLVDENGKVIGSKERAREITDELNSSLGTEFSWNEDNLENYREQAGAIDDLINKKRALRQIDVAEQNFDTAKETLPQLQDDIYNLEQDIAALEAARQKQINLAAEYTSLQQSQPGTWESGDFTDYVLDIYEAKQKAEALTAEIEEQQAKLDELRASEIQAQNDIAAYYDAYASYVAGDYDKVNEILEADVYRRLAHKAETEQLTNDELAELKRGREIAQRNLDRYLADVEAGTATMNEKIVEGYQSTIDELDAAIASQEQAAAEAGQRQVESFVNGMLGKMGLAINAASRIGGASASALDGGGGPRPGHAGGIDYVPYDNYPMYAHRGEMLLTAAEAEDYRRGERRGNVIQPVFNFYGMSESDMDYAADYINRKLVMG